MLPPCTSVGGVGKPIDWHVFWCRSKVCWISARALCSLTTGQNWRRKSAIRLSRCISHSCRGSDRWHRANVVSMDVGLLIVVYFFSTLFDLVPQGQGRCQPFRK